MTSYFSCVYLCVLFCQMCTQFIKTLSRLFSCIEYTDFLCSFTLKSFIKYKFCKYLLTIYGLCFHLINNVIYA